jgi:hypothetical protein
MNVKSTILLTLALTTLASSASTTDEPNDTAKELKFEMSTDVYAWTLQGTVGGKTNIYYNPGTIRPKYVAEVILPYGRVLSSRSKYQRKIMESPLAQELSPPQKDFISQGLAVWKVPHTDNVPEHSTLQLYAVSEEDARVMALALMDEFATEARERRAELERRLQEAKQEHERAQIELSEKEERNQQIEGQYGQYKKATHPSLEDDEAAQLAKDSIFQMGKEGNQLDIELAGIRAKLKVIEAYLSKPNATQIVEHLEAMKIDLEIELSSLEARRKAIERIHAAEQKFCLLYNERHQLFLDIRWLPSHLDTLSQTIRDLTEKLEHASDDLVPPKVFENRVTLYPIEPADSQN